MDIKVKRVYETYAKEDGVRILVDRLWPRGIKKEDAQIDKWFKEIAPSSELRKWYDHDPEKFEAFNQKYHAEIDGTKVLDELINYIREHKTVTLVFSSKELKLNNAMVLKNIIDEHTD
ncbi:DUF488 family protein [Mucilaginibacter sp. SMC90]|uniref:DUF488 domain-containing protein n=1 Tax=Mucilaginibacter sp. SMC90 TaxID=2929803 RepID=UPI001FB44574|nr:DUF488 family protein [Mucilaginibacter sp. SMC90]UOE51236.1 DUF488 family protein [Mucilaginibacter sp. SMC90]